MARGFSAGQDGLTPQYFVYYKENQHSIAGKAPPYGHVDMFQTRSSDLEMGNGGIV